MTVDIDQILLIPQGIYMVFVSIITIGVALYMLEIQLGSAIDNGMIILGSSMIYNLLVVFIIQKSFLFMLQQKDKRISLSKDLIEGMKSIKYLCWESIFDKKIIEIRRKEYSALIIIRICDGLSALFWNCINYILLYAFLISYIDKQHITNIKEGSVNIFAIIALFQVLVFPLGIIPLAFVLIYQGYSSYQRILKFLNEKEIDESEITRYKDNNCSFAISLKNVVFKWPTKTLEEQNDSDDYKDFQLSIDELKIQYSQISFLIGKLGSGKSALLFGIMNEMENLTKGRRGIEVRGSIALVTQNHWLQNISIRDNILFGLPYNSEWYQECIDACQLGEDFKSFSNGDKKIVSANGGNLSGGQKLRIAIARAIYADKDIYLFDDILSSLDIHVADAIFQQAIKGLLVRKNKCVLMVTSHYKYLQEPNIDIIFLDNGKQVKDKDYIQKYIQSNIQKQSQKMNEKTNFIDENLDKDCETLLLAKKIYSKEVQNEAEEEINEEYRYTGNFSFETYLVYMRACKFWIFLLLFVFNIFMQASRSLIDFWLRSEISDYPNQIFVSLDLFFNNQFSDTFTFLIILSVATTFIRVCAYVLAASFAAYLLFKKLNQSIMFSNMKFFDNNPCGRILNRLSSDVTVVDARLPWLIHVTLEQLVICLGFPIGVAIYFPWIGVFLVLYIFMMVYLLNLYRPSNMEIKRLSSVNDGKLISILGEICKGQPVIRAFENQDWMIRQYVQKLRDSIDTWVLNTSVYIWLEVRILITANIFSISTIVTCIILYGFELTNDYTTLSIALIYSTQSQRNLYGLMEYMCEIEQKFVSVERIKQYNTVNKQEQMDIVPNKEMEINQLEDCSLVFEDVFLTYDDKEVENKKYALKNFNLKIRNGEKIAICGRTGSGKSSILNILFRLYEIQGGRIFIKQKEIRTMSLIQLRSQMSIIPQFGFLYNASLKNNLDPSNKLQKEIVQKIIQESGLNIIKHRKKDLNATDEVEEVEEEEKIIDCDFVIENSGGNLSNGEKQIINFLRIIMKDEDIICLDEATSNMDPKSDEVLHNKLFSYSQGKTLIVITHRLENIDKFDRIVVLEQGEIVEIGHVSELRLISNGFFNKLLKN